MTPQASPWSGVPLTDERQPLCLVVAPGKPRWEELAHRFCVRVREYTRVEPEQRRPEQLEETDWQRYHLILFGSILDNPAILRLYARHLCFTDAAYPGIGGAEARTLWNPLANGRHVLLLGGSDYEAVHEMVIQLHRSFSEVTYWREGIFFLRRLNFAASTENCRWTPSPAELERILEKAKADPTLALGLAADYALYQYQSDEERWSEVLPQVLRPALERPVEEWCTGESSLLALWHLITAWNLAVTHPSYTDPFREQIAEFLHRVGEAVAEAFPSLEGIDRATVTAGLFLHRLGRFWERFRGTNPYASHTEALRRLLIRSDPGRRPDGLRDWLVVDQWLSFLFEMEAYDVLEDERLRELALEAFALTDNRQEPVISRADWEHAQNVLLKIAAFLDSGEPLWLRRWMRRGEPEPLYSPDRPRWSWNWYTGAYVPDRLPTPPREIPRLFRSGKPTPALVALRADLDPLNEYLALWGPGLSLRWLTWRGLPWLQNGGWKEAPSELRRVWTAELDGFGYLLLEGEGYRRHLLWRVGHFFALWERRDPELAERWSGLWEFASGVRVEEMEEGLLRLRQEGGELWMGTDRPRWDEWPAGAVETTTAWSPYRSTAGPRPSGLSVQLGPALCGLGELKLDGWSVSAEVACAVGRRLWAMGFRELRLEGNRTLRASRPIDLSLDRRTGAGLIRTPEPVLLEWSGGPERETEHLEPGEYRSTFLILGGSEESGGQEEKEE
ncbi:MAG: hypothetical protein KatS3mg115_1705 [Candidatus Poribacteria bacterium]|nr:MAG: hypothetical protein KatS3mg115_1705 [Candidatus Poribacteria bacterium]